MTTGELVQLIDAYAAAIDAPLQTHTTVTCVRRVADEGYEVVTDRGVWRSTSVVLASGPANVANVPAFAAEVPASIASVTPMTYRSAAQLADGGVLVVGGSATGVQLAEEIHQSGRPVTLSVGEHVRMPRTYRGRDIFWWLEAAGVLSERYDEMDDLVRARHVPSPQLIGTPERRSIDLTSLGKTGVEIVGRLGSVRDEVALFSGALANVCRLADLKLNRLLDRFDRWASTAEIEALDAPVRPEPTVVPTDAPLSIDLGRRGIRTILWATGYRADHSWLALPVFDARGRIRHAGGVVQGAPGVYLLGGNLLRTRRSSYIAGADEDTLALADHLQGYLGSTRARSVGSLH
jgi:putative flavoprotein involved in K+ transport